MRRDIPRDEFSLYPGPASKGQTMKNSRKPSGENIYLESNVNPRTLNSPLLTGTHEPGYRVTSSTEPFF